MSGNGEGCQEVTQVRKLVCDEPWYAVRLQRGAGSRFQLMHVKRSHHRDIWKTSHRRRAIRQTQGDGNEQALARTRNDGMARGCFLTPLISACP
jgi:hypothetical protein